MLQVSRSQCRGSYYVDESTARKACTAPPVERGYCCAGGKVSQTTRDSCQGTYSPSQAGALRACKAVILAPNPDAIGKGTAATPGPKSDGADKSKAVITKPNPNAVDKSKAVITSPNSSQMIKKTPPPSDNIR